MIPETILKEIEWVIPPKKIGGQHCGIYYPVVTLKSESTEFSCTIDSSKFRGIYRTKEVLLNLFELYLMESKQI